ncbi:MAG: hypothetical protein KAJ98_00360 [Spirochaetaceae bacterium]|nr:hypothetical protein [Spirochaetaceae bacterium]
MISGDGDGEAIREIFHRLHESKVLPALGDLSGILDAVLDALAGENPLIRPRDRAGMPGGLILLNSNITTILVPDLHARTGYMDSLIEMEIAGQALLDGLIEGSLQVLCVGDGFHSEARGAERWRRAWKEYKGGFRRHAAMDDEMREGLSLMGMVMILKTAFPDRFHFLKGNHENVANVETDGNRPFGKYAWEGQMVRDWFIEFLGDDMLDRWADFENSLPILAVGNRFLVSHAEPRRFYNRERMIEYRGDDELIFDFTWTGNGEAEQGSVGAMLEHYLAGDFENALYFGGNRPVHGLYGLRAEKRYVQIHNPERNIVAVLRSDRDPDPDRDIRTIEGDYA